MKQEQFEEAITLEKKTASDDLEKEDISSFNTWNSIPDSYNQLKKLVFALLSLFGSACVWEKFFFKHEHYQE